MSSDIEKEPLSRQQKKSKETKARIFHAAKTILQKQGYDQLSIKNICDEAGVSNGSFYHHFKTKDDLLSYYIEEQPSRIFWIRRKMQMRQRSVSSTFI
mgnify:CR=1 FL=1